VDRFNGLVMATQDEVDRARRILEIQERYTEALRDLDIQYRREMLDAAGEPQAGLCNPDRWTVEQIRDAAYVRP
jgi:hypothetical protein